MKYAIGEILLVVIGILIALQLNLWNENNKNRTAENEALIDLKLEFDTNINRLESIIERRQAQEDYYRTYLDLITDKKAPISEKINAETPNTWNGKWALIMRF